VPISKACVLVAGFFVEYSHPFAAARLHTVARKASNFQPNDQEYNSVFRKKINSRFMKNISHDTIVREQGVDYSSSLRGYIEFLPERQNISILKF
jgi:hypothetical protein